MKLYIYNVSTMEVEAIVNGSDNAECETKASDHIGNDEMLASTYIAPTVDGACGSPIITTNDPMIL